MSDQKQAIKDWLKGQLSAFLKFDVPDEMAEVALSLEHDKVDDHFRGLLGHKDGRIRKFVAEFVRRRRECNLEPISLKKSAKNDKAYIFKNSTVYKKQHSYFPEEAISFQVPENQQKKPSPKIVLNQNKKKKFVDFYMKGGEIVLLKGRYLCNCEAKKHKLINNCLSCGRIVCKQEGSGPCFVCDAFVCSPSEQLLIDGDAGKGSKLYENLVMQEKHKGLEEAIRQRNKLLEFDRNTEKQTHVFDDDSDYYISSNPWLTLQEREKLKKQEEEFFSKKNESRKNKKIVLKIEDNKLVEEAEEKLIAPSVSFSNNETSDTKEIEETVAPPLDSVDHILNPYFSNMNIEFKEKIERHHTLSNNHSEIRISHIMDNEINRLSDDGYCLSINQPWASFLVKGIRTAEGRTWYTAYRGKLWIASTGVRISRQDAATCENTYRLLKGDIKFPADYPHGALLGCVDLVNCLTQEQYREEYPDGELEDPYIFICENYQALPVRYPIKGKPNIYKLDEKIHTAAKMCLRTVEKVLFESDNKVKTFRP